MINKNRIRPYTLQTVATLLNQDLEKFKQAEGQGGSQVKMISKTDEDGRERRVWINTKLELSEGELGLAITKMTDGRFQVYLSNLSSKVIPLKVYPSFKDILKDFSIPKTDVEKINKIEGV